MARYLLDTNIVLFSLFNHEELEIEVSDLLDDYNNRFYVSSVSVQEIIHLYKKDRIETDWKRVEEILPSIESANIEILPVTKEHLTAFASLSVPANHNDPNDQIIISQAIAGKYTLISSDHKFESYTKQQLDFIFNCR